MILVMTKRSKVNNVSEKTTNSQVGVKLLRPMMICRDKTTASAGSVNEQMCANRDSERLVMTLHCPECEIPNKNKGYLR